jgi:hypothetical protein
MEVMGMRDLRKNLAVCVREGRWVRLAWGGSSWRRTSAYLVVAPGLQGSPGARRAALAKFRRELLGLYDGQREALR